MGSGEPQALSDFRGWPQRHCDGQPMGTPGIDGTANSESRSRVTHQTAGLDPKQTLSRVRARPSTSVTTRPSDQYHQTSARNRRFQPPHAIARERAGVGEVDCTTLFSRGCFLTRPRPQADSAPAGTKVRECRATNSHDWITGGPLAN